MKENFAGVYFKANRAFKNDALIPTLDPSLMLCGVSEAQFLAIVDYLENQKLPDGILRPRKSITSDFDRFTGYLCNGPEKGRDINNFQSATGGSLDGEVLWKWFLKREIDILSSSLQVLLPVGGVDTSSSILSTPISHVVNIKRGKGGRLEVFGSNTYTIKDYLRVTLKLTWDGESNSWWKLLGEGESYVDIKQGMTLALSPFGITLQEDEDSTIKSDKESLFTCGDTSMLNKMKTKSSLDDDDTMTRPDGGKKEKKVKDVKKCKADEVRVEGKGESRIKVASMAMVVGKTTTGEDCKTCLKAEGGFCKRHLCQRK